MRIAVLLEPGRRGVAALRAAVDLAAERDAELTIVAVAPTAQTACRSCGGVSPRAYNCAVRDDAADELDRAFLSVHPTTARIDTVLLVEHDDPPLHDWLAAHSFDLVLLPARIGLPHSRRHPAARSLRRHAGLTVRVL